ncbi:MAG: aminotransferase, partial [Lachnospiraceae bacterium]|nr:aminotransferase [Lachnospiraceae bacterium]
MKAYKEMGKEELVSLKASLENEFAEAKSKGLKLDMSRGKQTTAQLDMTMDIMDVFDSDSVLRTEDGTDCRNYGLMDGIPEAKKLLGDI